MYACGRLEHIYDVPQAFVNIVALSGEAGQIVHVLQEGKERKDASAGRRKVILTM